MMKTVTLPVKGLNFAGCAREIEKRLGNVEPIKQVEASYVSQTVTITYDETHLSEAQLREMVHDCGFLCGEPATAFAEPHIAESHAVAPPDMEHVAHAPPEMAGMKGMEHGVGGMEH